MGKIKDLKYQIELIDYLSSEEHIIIEQSNHVRSKNEQEELEDTREPDSYYPLCFY